MESLILALLWFSNQPEVLNILSTATLVGHCAVRKKMPFFRFLLLLYLRSTYILDYNTGTASKIHTVRIDPPQLSEIYGVT